MSNTLQISLTEKQLLKSFIDYPEYLIEDDIFISDIGKEFHYILLSLKDENLNTIPEHILKKSIEYVNEKAIQAVLDISYQKEHINTYIKELNTYNKLHNIENSILKNLTIELTKKGTKDLEVIKNLYNELGNILDSIENCNENNPLTFHDALIKHEDTLIKRSSTKLQTSGCYLFDKIMPNIIPGLCTISGYSGSMKTTTMLYLAKQRLIKRLPTCYVNTELAFTGFMDNSISSMIKEPYYDILGISHTTDHEMIDFNGIIEKYEKLIDKYQPHDKFLLYPKSSCSIQELKQFILYSRKKMKLNNDTTLFVIIDLMSMLDEFGNDSKSNKADSIENGVNKINDIGLSTNSLILGTVQLRRIEPVKKIEREEDIEKFKPTLSGLKSSGAWEERSRWVIALHNPYHIVHKWPCNPILKESIDPILELTILKDTYTGMTGTSIQYYFNSEYKNLSPYENTDNI